VAERVHPVHRFLGRLHEVLDQVLDDVLGETGTPASWSMSVTELTDVLVEAPAAVARLQGLFLGLVADADRTDLAAETGAVSTAGLLRCLTRVSGPDASTTLKLSRALHRHRASAAALAAGAISQAQAAQIVAAVDALPTSVSPAEVARAEAHLLEAAVVHDARELGRLGSHLVEVVDADHADQLLAQRLAKEERAAERRTYLECYDRGDGTSEGRYRIPTRHQVILDRCLGALLNPNRPDPIPREHGTRAEARGQAFTQLLERIPAHTLPRTGGMNATVRVTMTLDTLLGGLRAAHLDTGHPISPTLARRLACQAGVIPAVLDGQGAVLDLGPHVRFHTEKQRLAMALQQHGTCAVEDCDRPAWLCAGAHLKAHADGGHTSVQDGALLCPRHHALADSPRYRIHRIRPGRIRLIRRQ
jgi:hypothetical protein